jgi:poly(3-hydroxybutyrate) depolymerase
MWLRWLSIGVLTCVVACVSSDPGITGITLTPPELSLEVAAKGGFTVKLEGATDNAVVSWRSAAPNIASADPSSGEVTGVSEGTAVITASAGGRDASATVRVQDNRIATVKVAPNTATLSPNATQVLTASAANTVGRALTATFTWSTSDSSLATVNDAGVVTAKASGTVTITATAQGKSGSATLTIPLPTLPSARQTRQSLSSANGSAAPTRVRFWQYLPEDYASSTASYPLLIFLHGAGETSKDDTPSADETEYARVLVHGPPKLVKNNNDLCFTVAGVRSCFIVLSPQAPKSDGWWNTSRIRALLDYAKQNLRVDTKRVYLTGLSMGGGGTWNFAGTKTGSPAQTYASELAAILPIAGASGVSSAACNIASTALPVWAFHGTADTIVSPQTSRDFVNAINGIKVGTVQCPSSTVKALLTEYSGVGHDSWTRTYDPANRFDPQTTQASSSGVNIYEWMLSKTR